MGAADDDELFRRPGASPPPGPPPALARVPRYPQPASRQPPPAPPAAAARTARGHEPALQHVDDRVDPRPDDVLDDRADDVEGRRPWSWPLVAAVLVASVAGVLAGLVLLRPALEAGEQTREPTAGPSLPASPSGDAPATTTATSLPAPITATPTAPGQVTDAPLLSSSSSSSSLPSSPPVTLTAIGEDASARQLRSLRDGDRARVRFTGQWVAQLAAKYSGIVDPLQTTLSGSHRFAAQDILAEHQVLRGRFGAGVVLLLGTDHSPRVSGPSGRPVWVTSYTGPFRSGEAVQEWCRSSFPGLDGTALADHCVPRRFTP